METRVGTVRETTAGEGTLQGGPWVGTEQTQLETCTNVTQRSSPPH